MLESQRYYRLSISATLLFTHSRICHLKGGIALVLKEKKLNLRHATKGSHLLKQPSVLALFLTAMEIQAQKCVELTGAECLQKHSKINGSDLTFWQKLISKCSIEYS